MLSPTNKDSTYYWDGVSFLVGGCMFKVPRHRFGLSSKSFAASHFLDAENWNQELNGFSESRPITFDDVSAEEFRSLLKLLFPVYTTTIKLELSKKEWLNVLRLSTMWHFRDFRKLAITTLDGLLPSPTERACLAREYHISAWLVQAFEALVTQPSAISEKQARAVDLLTAVRLYAIRDAATKAELLCEKEKNSRYRTAKPMMPADLKEYIFSTFEVEIKSIKEAELEHLTDEDKEDPAWRQLCLARDQEVLKLKERIEMEEVNLKKNEEAIMKKKAALEEERERLAKVLADPPATPGNRSSLP